MVGVSSLTTADRDRAADQLEMASLYLRDGAFNTALDRARDALKIVEVLATERAEFLAKVR